MRRQEREIRDRASVEALFRSCPVGRLATVGGDGAPVIKPVNFAYADGVLYLHSAREGEKIADLARDPRVCFEVDQPIAFVRSRRAPCAVSFLYRSALAWGRARLVEDPEEARRALSLLLDKHAGPGWGALDEGAHRSVAVIAIAVERWSGKENLGAGELRERALAALASGAALPVTLEGS